MPGRGSAATTYIRVDPLVPLYGGYFAAGFGVLLLAVPGLLPPGEGLQRLSALTGVLSLIIGAVAAATYAVVGPVAWSRGEVDGGRLLRRRPRGRERGAAPGGDSAEVA